ncbi:MAG: hypothetical protein A4E53_00708 [Pelotomaculum sp. PtaB.Bin104]|nr:MAG: hypothetical protein A4E53_00708 [Pelotomaculum sp. PtaB.Bin104]
MKIKILVFILLMIMLFTSGCNKPKTETSINPVDSQTVNTISEFRTTYEHWTGLLSDIADSTSNAYDSWVAGQINKEEFVTKTRQNYEQMKQLKKQSDLKKEFILTENDKQKVNYDAVLHAYNNAKKDLNDFLYMVPQLQDEQIKTMYNNKIKENFNEDISELKKQLGLTTE